jgi:hypothetical protein
VSKAYGTKGPRAIKPEMALDPALARCTIGAQLLFDRLIAAADDQGRLIGDGVVVKAECFPRVSMATPRRVDAWLEELAAKALIVRYENKGEPLVQIRGWWKHQQNQRRAYPSRYPAPQDWTDHVTVEPERLDGGPTARTEKP